MSNNKTQPAWENDPQMQQYFQSLPAYIQESIKQSGVSANSVEELRRCAENLAQGR